MTVKPLADYKVFLWRMRVFQ